MIEFILLALLAIGGGGYLGWKAGYVAAQDSADFDLWYDGYNEGLAVAALDQHFEEREARDDVHS